jgi:hypothetical protein
MAAGGVSFSSGGMDGLGGDGCASRCDSPNGYLVESGFEGDMPGELVETNGATGWLETEIVHSGNASFGVTQGATGTEAEIIEVFDAVKDAELYFRGWIYLTDGSVKSWLKLVAFHGGELEGANFFALQNLAFRVELETDLAEKTSVEGIVPENQWFCLQIAMRIADVGGYVKVQVDKNEVFALEQVDTDPGAGITRVVYGIADTGNDQWGATAYFDDVAVDTAYLPCE